jgi:hypothetical protein
MSAFGGKADLNMTGRDFDFDPFADIGPGGASNLNGARRAGRSLSERLITDAPIPFP